MNIPGISLLRLDLSLTVGIVVSLVAFWILGVGLRRGNMTNGAENPLDRQPVIGHMLLLAAALVLLVMVLTSSHNGDNQKATGCSVNAPTQTPNLSKPCPG